MQKSTSLGDKTRLPLATDTVSVIWSLIRRKQYASQVRPTCSDYVQYGIAVTENSMGKVDSAKHIETFCWYEATSLPNRRKDDPHRTPNKTAATNLDNVITGLRAYTLTSRSKSANSCLYHEDLCHSWRAVAMVSAPVFFSNPSEINKFTDPSCLCMFSIFRSFSLMSSDAVYAFSSSAPCSASNSAVKCT
jgi:hypothetical protein